MIKLPKEVSTIIKSVENKGYECYVVGECVRDSLLGEDPLDWDMVTNIPFENMKELFPDAKVLSNKYSVIRFDYTNEDEDTGVIIDLSAMRKENSKDDLDDVGFVDNIEEDLARRDFTINAIADNPTKAIVDLYGGREDIKKKLVRAVGDANVKFQKEPICMLKAIRLSAELGFDLHKGTYEAIVNNVALLKTLGVDAIREEFVRIIAGSHAGKGIKMLVACGALPYIIGEEAMNSVSGREMSDLEGLAEGIEKTQRVESRRLGLFYYCFGKKRALSAIDYLNYDEEIKQHLIDGVNLLQVIYFFGNKEEFKDFLAHYGYQRYEYVHNLSKAYAIVYNTPTIKIKNRIHMYKEIVSNKEPIYVEDLAISAEDLVEAGITDSDGADKILILLTDIVHRKPKKNNREELLSQAKRLSKNKVAVALRKVSWMR